MNPDYVKCKFFRSNKFNVFSSQKDKCQTLSALTQFKYVTHECQFIFSYQLIKQSAEFYFYLCLVIEFNLYIDITHILTVFLAF